MLGDEGDSEEQAASLDPFDQPGIHTIPLALCPLLSRCRILDLHGYKEQDQIGNSVFLQNHFFSFELTSMSHHVFPEAANNCHVADALIRYRAEIFHQVRILPKYYLR